MNSRFLVLITLLLLVRATGFAAAFLDITGLVPLAGTGASFTGTVGGIGVTGTLTGGPNTAFNSDVPPGIGFSTTAGTSPQWSHPSAYAETTPLGDRVGFSQTPGGSALVSLSFASPVTDLIFHVANLDFSFLDFSPSIGGGLSGMTLLSGNGGAGDGLGMSAPIIFDVLPGTADTTPLGVPPPTTGPRSAYGSILLSGTYSSLGFVIAPGAGIDDANFTLSTVPEPGMTTLVALGAAGLLLRRRRQSE